MKKVKRILAVLLSMAMILGMTVTASAEIVGTNPSEQDTGTITVQNVEDGATVKAYQVVKAVYNENGINGFSKYAPVNLTDSEGTNLTITDPLKPTEVEISAIANAIENGKLTGLTSATLTQKNGSKDYTADVAAGYWIVLIDNTATTMYNPMLAGVAYANKDGSENTLEGGTIDSKANWALNGVTAYAKSTQKPPFEKIIVNPESGNVHGDDTEIGDTVEFKITTTIPSYSQAYKNLKFKIYDKISEGLDFTGTYNVTVGENKVEDGTDTYTCDLSTNKRDFTISFAESFIRSHGNQQVVITYSATLNENAKTNFDPNTNDAKLTYTNDPTGTTGEEKDKTYHYTFEIDGMLNGSSGKDTIKTSELIKVDENGNVTNQVNTIDKTSATVTNPLDGAEFGLYKNEKCTGQPFKSSTSDKDGYINFKGLDAGTYYLKETKAPDGYQLDSTIHEIVIKAEYNQDGTLAKYEITIDGQRTSTYTATYDKGIITEIDSKVESTVIKNTKLVALPSTGGIGTTIFTIGGCAIMIAAAGLYFASRRKENK